MDIIEVQLTPERQAFLALKGRLLYGKYCGTKGEGICAESFVVYHLQRGEAEVVVEFLAFLEEQLALLQVVDRGQRLAMTERLVSRIRHHLDSALVLQEDEQAEQSAAADRPRESR